MATLVLHRQIWTGHRWLSKGSGCLDSVADRPACLASLPAINDPDPGLPLCSSESVFSRVCVMYTWVGSGPTLEPFSKMSLEVWFALILQNFLVMRHRSKFALGVRITGVFAGFVVWEFPLRHYHVRNTYTCTWRDPKLDAGTDCTPHQVSQLFKLWSRQHQLPYVIPLLGGQFVPSIKVGQKT